MSQGMSFTPMGYQIATALLIASPAIVTAFWIGTMLRRSVSTREWFGVILLWAIALPTLKFCFLRTPLLVAPTGSYYAPATTYYVQPANPPPSLSGYPAPQPDNPPSGK